MQRTVLICLLVALTLVVFFPVTRCDFVNYDDPDYVTDNPVVRNGCTWDGVWWAFGNLHGRRTYWHPVTWVSHMLDVQLFGLNPKAHHAINLLFHTINVVLLFTLLNRLTGAIWRSALAASIFAIHPCQVESVAWIAERKNLLGGMFWLVSLLAYERYTVYKGPLRYLTSLALFAIGLMCKPILVTFPIILLLVDFWPLRRFKLETASRKQAKALLIEKLPFFGLALAAGVVTIMAHQSLGLIYGERLSVWLRLYNAFVSYARYLWKTIWPHDLAVLYPHPGVWPVGLVLLSLVLIVGTSVYAVLRARRWPTLFAGWFWFIVLMLPTIGIIQAGTQAMADRFAYLPLIGLSFASIWLITDCTARFRYGRIVNTGIALVALVGFSARTVVQTAYWSNSIALWSHTLTITGPNYIAHQNLASALYQAGRREAAKEQVLQSLQIVPNFAAARCQLGQILSDEGRLDEAIVEFQAAATLDPNWADVPLYLARSFTAQGKTAQAAAEYRKELHLDAHSLVALNNLGWILATDSDASLRNGAEAVNYASRACELTGGETPVYLGTLAAALAENGEFGRAVATAQKAHDISVRLNQGSLAAKNQELATLFASRIPYREHQ